MSHGGILFGETSLSMALGSSFEATPRLRLSNLMPLLRFDSFWIGNSIYFGVVVHGCFMVEAISS